MKRRAWVGIVAVLAGSMLTNCTALIGLGDEPTLDTDASNSGGPGGSSDTAGAAGSPTAGASGSQTGGSGGAGGSPMRDASLDGPGSGGSNGPGGSGGNGGTAGTGGASGASGSAGAGMMGDGGCPTCDMPCSTDATCAPAGWCDTTRTPAVCVPKKPVGQACTSANNNQCADGHCVDGFCCDTGCTGQCEACNVGTPGTCSQVIGAPHTGKTACAGTGMCAASCSASRTMCTFPTVQCRAPMCSGGVLTLGASCDGAGACPAAQTMMCGGPGCNGAGNACNVPCSNDAGCPSGWCDTTSGQCQPKKANGQKCGGDNQCTNAHCVDTYCCNAVCSGQCEACDVATVEGTCSQVNGAPHTGKTACSGTGMCVGSCSGTRTACTFPTVQCRAQTCSGGTITNSAQCSMGSCPGATTTPCGTGFACMGAGCAGTCDAMNDTGCLAGRFCNGGNQCLTTKPNGRACGTASECTNVNCVGSVCCNSACSGACNTCSTGTCGPLAPGATGVGCGMYLCQGATTCPTTCTANSQCTTNICNTAPPGCSTVSCFVAGTPVETDEGLRPIETVQPGDKVRAFDTATGEPSWRAVILLEKRVARELVSLSVAGSAPIRVSPEHYFWVKGSGWVRAAELTMDDFLLGQGREPRQVEALEMLSVPERGEPVYNLVVDGFDDYFVGETPVLVHSCDYMNYSAVARERLPE